MTMPMKRKADESLSVWRQRLQSVLSPVLAYEVRGKDAVQTDIRLKGREREGNGGGEGDRIRGQEGIQVCIKRRGRRGYEEGRERQTHSHRGRKKGSDDEKS